MHVAKYAKAATGHMCAHYERRKDEKGDYIKFGNQDIDLNRTHLNYNLAPEHDQIDFIRQRIGEVKCQKRADVNVMCDWVVTVPAELDRGHLRDFFKASYEFLEERYGRENVISAYVHMDETTPHMHFAFIPVVKDKKKDIYKVSAKQLLTKTELKRMHPDLTRHIQAYSWGKNLNMMNGATIGGNQTIEELKLEKKKKEREFFEEKAEKAKKEFNFFSKKVRERKDEIVYIKAQIEPVQQELDEQQAELKRIKEVDLPQARQELVVFKSQAERMGKIYEAYEEKANRAHEELIRTQAELKQIKEIELPQAQQGLVEVQESVRGARAELRKLTEQDLPQAKQELAGVKEALKHTTTIIQDELRNVLQEATVTFKKVLFAYRQGLPGEKAVAYAEQSRQLYNGKVDQLKIPDTVKKESRDVIDQSAADVQEEIRPRHRRGR